MPRSKASATLGEIRDDLQFTSDRISTQVRSIAFSVLSLVWLFLLGGPGLAALPRYPDRRLLLLAAILSVSTLVADYLQYAFGYVVSDRLRAEIEGSESDAGQYDYGSPLYRARTALFWLKQALALAAVGILVFQIAGAIL